MKLSNSIKIPLLVIFSITGFALSINFPDLDISIFGIGMHRFFLFHSAIIPLLLLVILKIIVKPEDTVEMIVTGFLGSFSLGIGIHLFFDLFQAKAVMFPFIGSLVDGTSLDDRIWLIVNILVCLLISGLLYRKAFRLLGIGKPAKEPVFAQMKKTVDVDLNRMKRKIRPEFEIYSDSRGEYRFRLKAPNGEVILRSEGYSTKRNCLNGINAVKKYALADVVEKTE